MLRRSFQLVALIGLVGGDMHAQARLTCEVVPKSMAAMKGCYRPLLVFSPSGDDARLKKQVEMLDADADDMMDRFVLYTPIVPDREQVTTPADAPYTVLSQAEMTAARKQFHIPTASFRVLLLDEDGSVMLSGVGPLITDRLNASIDKTPTRQAEMRRPHAN